VRQRKRVVLDSSLSWPETLKADNQSVFAAREIYRFTSTA